MPLAWHALELELQQLTQSMSLHPPKGEDLSATEPVYKV